jgi:uncharacterized membrane protein
MTRHLVAAALGSALALSPTPAAADEADDDFAARCAHPDVVKCVGFDGPDDIAGGAEDNSGILSGATTPMLDDSTRLGLELAAVHDPLELARRHVRVVLHELLRGSLGPVR